MSDLAYSKPIGGVMVLVSIEPGLLADSPSRIARVELLDSPEKLPARPLEDPNHPQIVIVLNSEWRIVQLDTGAIDPLMAQHFMLEALKNLSNTILAASKLLGIQSREYLAVLQSMSPSRN